ncbi:DUF3558 domain-containing protein [Solihabitans fulvus]|uniref:DUF3558 domain-containing protein n=1 Tax=Solihabitans fulvus TaxID=1892852 RepID=A0A5B2WVG4_9PSEU|nr:DUF3558 family protein [Solihabitans fulvus]KAA2254894.1 DUF3558 domain-containing protein [Solihabitans fulvus]
MHIRKFIAALAAVTLPLALTACAQQVSGSPVAAAGQSTATKSASDTGAVPASQAGGTVSKPKKIDKVNVCDLFVADDIKAIVGGTVDAPPSGTGCTVNTTKPSTTISINATATDKSIVGDSIQIGGNSAVQQKSNEGCGVFVLLSTDPNVLVGMLDIRFFPIRPAGDPCEITKKIAAMVFDKLPSA